MWLFISIYHDSSNLLRMRDAASDARIQEDLIFYPRTSRHDTGAPGTHEHYQSHLWTLIHPLTNEIRNHRIWGVIFTTDMWRLFHVRHVACGTYWHIPGHSYWRKIHREEMAWHCDLPIFGAEKYPSFWHWFYGLVWKNGDLFDKILWGIIIFHIKTMAIDI